MLTLGLQGAISCDKPGQATAGNRVTYDDAGEGLETLRNGDDCFAAAGECARTSCSNDAAMYLCAPEDSDVNIPCPDVGQYIENIYDECAIDGMYAVNMAFGSQENSDGWHVELAWNSC